MASTTKKVLLVGKLLKTIPTKEEVPIEHIELFAASCLEEVKQVFEISNNQIDIVISGGGIELEKRLEIVRYVFETSNATSVHMKDIDTGPEGFVPFINKILKGLLY